MPAEPLALSTRPPLEPADTDYEAICAAVTATARGRWFLDEYARRNRNSDTAQVLDAIARMEAALLSERAKQMGREATQEVRIGLLEMARTIAQTRAEVAESRPQPPQDPAAPPADSSPAPDVAATAERLRQIAWTMRACGVELPVSEQIGEIADAILSADALRNPGDQRMQRLIEALHYLEQRIDRMLEGHRPEAAAAVPAPVVPLRQASGHGAVAGRAAPLAIVATTAPADIEAPAAAAVADTARAAPEPDAAELSIDDDVVLTVADTAAEAPIPSPPALELASPALPEFDEAADERTLVVDDLVDDATAEADAIALQVDQDLDHLTYTTPANDTARGVKEAPLKVQPVHAPAMREEDPADFLLEAPNDNIAPSAARTRAAHTMVSHALAAIETEFRADPEPVHASAHVPRPPAAAKPQPVADGPLAALMAMSEEERIALFS
jgi:hypothetical protein